MEREFSKHRPLGFLRDIGAPKDVAGRKEITHIKHSFGMKRKNVFPSVNRFRFASESCPSFGRISVPLNRPAGIPTIYFDLDIVNADRPPLLGMNISEKESLTPCKVSNRLIKRV